MGLSTKKSGEDLCTQLYPYVPLAPNAWGALDPSPHPHKPPPNYSFHSGHS